MIRPLVRFACGLALVPVLFAGCAEQPSTAVSDTPEYGGGYGEGKTEESGEVVITTDSDAGDDDVVANDESADAVKPIEVIDIDVAMPKGPPRLPTLGSGAGSRGGGSGMWGGGSREGGSGLWQAGSAMSEGGSAFGSLPLVIESGSRN